ncbi:MAG: hypothetical protein JWN41_1176, partial [Thermoleophilia bacterium]|nr:hypothetical protein [Thermoleophilia bacterium]
MSTAAILRELRDGHSPALRTAIAALAAVTFVAAMYMALLSPSMNGLVGLPGHLISKEASPITHVTRPPRVFTKAQQRIV